MSAALAAALLVLSIGEELAASWIRTLHVTQVGHRSAPQHFLVTGLGYKVHPISPVLVAA
jgi:hypothetical protein